MESIQERLQLLNEARRLIDLINFEWQSDPMSVACFDNRIIAETQAWLARHDRHVKEITLAALVGALVDVYEEDIYAVRQVFKRNCFGVVLSERTSDDPHVCFTIIVEDDGNWFVNGKDAASAVWVGELHELLGEANRWMVEHCKKDVGGWRFEGTNG